MEMSSMNHFTSIVRKFDRYPNNEEKQRRSKEADENYERQLSEVLEKNKKLPEVHKNLVTATRQVLNALAVHFEASAKATQTGVTKK